MTFRGTQEQSGDEADLEYWRSQAEYWHQKHDERAKEIEAITTPETIRFRGVDGDVMWERDLYKVSACCWDLAVQNKPYLESWHRVESGCLLLALSPASSVTFLSVEQEVVGDA